MDAILEFNRFDQISGSALVDSFCPGYSTFWVIFPTRRVDHPVYTTVAVLSFVLMSMLISMEHEASSCKRAMYVNCCRASPLFILA